MVVFCGFVVKLQIIHCKTNLSFFTNTNSSTSMKASQIIITHLNNELVARWTMIFTVIHFYITLGYKYIFDFYNLSCISHDVSTINPYELQPQQTAISHTATYASDVFSQAYRQTSTITSLITVLAPPIWPSLHAEVPTQSLSGDHQVARTWVSDTRVDPSSVKWSSFQAVILGPVNETLWQNDGHSNRQASASFPCDRDHNFRTW